MSDTIFDKIVRSEAPSYNVWEDDNYLAFLTPFANTTGQTVVIPKTNQAAYAFDLSADQLTGLMLAVQKVAKLLEQAFGVEKVAMVFEGEGVPYVHAKLYPMHGELGQGSGHERSEKQFYDSYPGYISTIEGPEMSPEDLAAAQAKIVGVQA